MEPQQIVSDLISLDGKVGVVSGAASGIGLGVATRLAEAGSAVALLDIALEWGYAAEKDLKERGFDARFYDCDVTSDSSCRDAITQVVSDFGQIDILVNNAGVAVRKNAVDLEEEEWDLAVNVTLKGAYMLSHHVLPLMIEAGGGSIINTGSGWSLTGGENAGEFLRLLGNGKEFGLKHIHYTYQEEEGGIAEALGLAEHFADGERLIVVLGDNIIENSIREAVENYKKQERGAKILLKEVDDPERFGVAELRDGRVIRIEEKPISPKSRYAVTGIYMYDSAVFEIIKTLVTI